MHNQKELEELNAHFVEKSETKQEVYQRTLAGFEQLKAEAEKIIEGLKSLKDKSAHELDLSFSSVGRYEAEMRFAGDALSIQMHTNVFAFPEEHYIYKTRAVKEDESNGYCGMILFYNFLADSLRYNRFLDSGYLLGRVFINRNGNFFIQGRRQLSFLYQDFDEQLFNEEYANKIVQTAVKQSVDFDLYVPPFDEVKEVTLQQKIVQQGNTAIKTGKRLGFIYDSHEGKS